MKAKVIVAGIIITVALVFGALSFVESNVEYTDFRTAMASRKTVQVKGEWVQDLGSEFDLQHHHFIFYMRDDNGMVTRVVYEGAKPNNFEIATSLVVKGRFIDNYFHATNILTKCPSKYEGDVEAMKKTL